MTTKEYEEFVKQAAFFDDEIGLAYAAIGISDEGGEVAGKIKKLYRDEKYHKQDAVGQALLRQANREPIGKELGDVLWYIVALGRQFDLSLDDIMEMNVEKITSRKERGTLKGSGDDR